jgi:signal recognition particle subunit SEC65
VPAQRNFLYLRGCHNKEWEEVKNAIIEAANNIIKKQDKQNRNEWWDEECRRAIQETNIARKKYMHTYIHTYIHSMDPKFCHKTRGCGISHNIQNHNNVHCKML